MKHFGLSSSIQVSQTTTRSLLCSIGITAGVGIFLDFAKVPLITAESIAAVFGLTSFVVGQYISLVPAEVKKRIRLVPELSQILVPVSLISFSAVLIFGVSVVAPVVQARARNSELQRAAYGRPEFSRAQHIFKSALYDKVKLNPKLVSEVIDQSALSAERNSWSAYLAGVNYVLSRQSLDENAPTYGHSAFDLGHDNSFKEVRLTGFTIVYHGGKLALNQVTFLNCTFEVDETENGKRLLQAVVAANGTPFSLDLP